MQAPGIPRARRPFLAPLWVGALVLAISAVVLMAAFRLGARWFGETTTVIVLRHAEKAATDSPGSEGPPLAEAGYARAARLEGLLRDSGAAAIFVSDTRRARETAAPLAGRLGLRLTEYPGRDLEGLVRRLREAHRGQTVVVIGHSNTVPELLAILSEQRVRPVLHDADYDRVFVVSMNRFDPPTVLTLRY